MWRIIEFCFTTAKYCAIIRQVCQQVGNRRRGGESTQGVRDKAMEEKGYGALYACFQSAFEPSTAADCDSQYAALYVRASVLAVVVWVGADSLVR